MGLGLSLALASVLTTPTPNSRFATIAASIGHRLRSTGTPSVAISVSQDGRVLWETGFGLADRERHVKARADIPYAIASVSKSLTSAALAILAENHAVDLDAPINRYLHTKLRSYRWNADSVTVREVAQHRGGLTTYYRYCVPGDPRCRFSMVHTIERYGVIFWQPGQLFDYSNLGYGVLGDVISTVSHMSYATFMNDRVFEPLGMAHTFVGDGPLRPAAAPRYVNGVHRVTQFVEFTPGASAVYASAHDLDRFGMFMLGERVTSGTPILSESARSQILNRTVKAVNPFRYGLGWWVEENQYGYRVVYAQGGASGDNAALVLIPSARISIAVVSNGDTLSTLDVAGDITAALLPRYARSRRENTPAPTVSPQHALQGTWTGYVYTYHGRIPLTLRAGRGEKATLAIGRGTPHPFRVDSFRRHAQGRTSGDLDLDEIANGAYDIFFDLAPERDTLYGAFTTDPHPGAPNAGLSFWVELHRVPNASTRADARR